LHTLNKNKCFFEFYHYPWKQMGTRNKAPVFFFSIVLDSNFLLFSIFCIGEKSCFRPYLQIINFYGIKGRFFFLVSFLSPNSNKKTGALFRGFRYREICFYAPPLKGKSGQKSWTTFSSIFKICLLFRGFLFSIIFGWKNISKSFEKKVVQHFGIFLHFFVLRGA